IAVLVSLPSLCCVTPIAQQMASLSTLAISLAIAFKSATEIPVSSSAYASVNGSKLFLYTSKLFTHLSMRSEEHTSELQSRFDLVCRLLLEKKNTNIQQ